jgi:hypothetical protein
MICKILDTSDVITDGFNSGNDKTRFIFTTFSDGSVHINASTGRQETRFSVSADEVRALGEAAIRAADISDAAQKVAA